MLRNCLLSCFVMLACVVVCGCEAGGPSASVPDAATAMQNQSDESLDGLKKVLQQVKDSGSVSQSSFFGAEAALRAAGKADLIPQLNQIVAAASPEDRKSLASSLLGKLE